MKGPINSHSFDAAFAQAVQKGWMSAVQYRFVTKLLLSSPGCSFLVFGTGYDSQLWAECKPGTLMFVEDQTKYLTLAPASARIVLYEYRSRVGHWFSVPDVPPLVDRLWDFVLVDGPTGYNGGCPGRQFPITWSRELALRGVFVHDYERPWEHEVCNQVWGPPTEVVYSSCGISGDLAYFCTSSDTSVRCSERATS